MQKWISLNQKHLLKCSLEIAEEVKAGLSQLDIENRQYEGQGQIYQMHQ